MKKSFDGLVASAKTVIRKDPLSVAVFVFCNRRRHILKVLLLDGRGFSCTSRHYLCNFPFFVRVLCRRNMSGLRTFIVRT